MDLGFRVIEFRGVGFRDPRNLLFSGLSLQNEAFSTCGALVR